MPSRARYSRKVLLGVWIAALELQRCLVLGQGTETDQLKLPSPWVKIFDTHLWAGYKDNVLLASRNVEESPFIAGGFDVTLFRVPENGWEYLVLGSGEYIRYLKAEDVDQEATAILQAQVHKTFGKGWKLGLAGEYIYFNQVLDATTLPEERTSVQVEGHGLTVRPSLSKAIGTKYRVELEFPAARQMFVSLIDDYWEVGPKVTFGRALPNKSDLAISYQVVERLHDTREARDWTGVLEPGHGLKFLQQEIAGTWRWHFDAERRWRSTMRVSLQRNDDNGGGYYDYTRPQLSEQIRYQRPTWELRAEARVAYYHYDSQRIADVNSAVREKTYIRASLRGEKAITKSLKLFGQYEYERALSNLDFDAYNANTFAAGIDWEF